MALFFAVKAHGNFGKYLPLRVRSLAVKEAVKSLLFWTRLEHYFNIVLCFAYQLRSLSTMSCKLL